MVLKNPFLVFLLRKIAVGIIILFLASWMVSTLMHSASRQPKDRPQVSYGEWVTKLFTLNFATPELFVKTSKTLILTFGSLVVSLLVSVPLGISSAIRRDSRGLKLVTSLADFLCSTPVFVTGYIFILLGIKIFQQNFAAIGGERSFFTPILMFLTLGLSNGTVSEMMRHTREETIRILEQNYFKAVVARGVNLKKHFVKSLLIPFLNLVSSRIVYLLSGAVVVEFVFSWEGIGKWSWDSVLKPDYLAVMNITFILVVFVLLVRFSSSLATAYLDSRRR